MNKSFYTYYTDFSDNPNKFKFTVKKVYNLYMFSMSGSTDVFNHNHVQEVMNSHRSFYGRRVIAASDKIKQLIKEGRL